MKWLLLGVSCLVNHLIVVSQVAVAYQGGTLRYALQGAMGGMVIGFVVAIFTSLAVFVLLLQEGGPEHAHGLLMAAAPDALGLYVAGALVGAGVGANRNARRRRRARISPTATN